MFTTYLVIFLLRNIASMIWESVTKPPFGLSYVNKILTPRFLASDSVDNICGNTVDKTINFECLLCLITLVSFDTIFWNQSTGKTLVEEPSITFGVSRFFFSLIFWEYTLWLLLINLSDFFLFYKQLPRALRRFFQVLDHRPPWLASVFWQFLRWKVD